MIQLTIGKHGFKKEIDFEIGDKPFSDLMIHVYVSWDSMAWKREIGQLWFSIP